MASVLPTILSTIEGLLEGSQGSGRTITAGIFKVQDFNLEDAKAVNQMVQNPRPVMIGLVQGKDGSLPSDVSNSYVYGATGIEIHVGYAAKPNQIGTLRDTIENDWKRIKRALDWPPNWALATGWVGLTELSREFLELDFPNEDNKPNIAAYLLVVKGILSYREDYGSE